MTDQPLECEGHESIAGPIGNVFYCDGSCRAHEKAEIHEQIATGSGPTREEIAGEMEQAAETLRERRDATGAEIFDEPDGALEAMVASESVTPATRDLARLELERRAFLARARAQGGQ